MSDFETSFRQLIAPLTPEEFFREVWDQRAFHIAGDADKFSHLFSWNEFNRLLNMSKLWSDRTMKIVLDGRHLDAGEYARAGRTRERNQAMLPEPELVLSLLRRGATIILDLIETLAPGVAAIAGALQAATGSVAVCNGYCSWSAHQGFPVHFDTTDVIAIHFEGVKVWRIYEGRAEQPVDVEGHNFESFAPEHHARAKGKLLKEIEMQPGHVLYLPRGQYHEALASSEACLHLSFGINQPTGVDLIKLVSHSLVDEEFFRRSIPHFDRPQAHREYMQMLGIRLQEILAQPDVSDQMRSVQRERALRDGYARFRLPARESTTLYRVRSMGVVIEPDGEGAMLRFPGGELPLTNAEQAPARWILAHDYFEDGEFRAHFEDSEASVLGMLLERLEASSVLDRM